MRIRPATLDDAHAIATVHVQSWQAAYRGVVADAVLDGLSIGERASRWRARLHPPAEAGLGPSPRTLVATLREQVVGFASGGQVDGAARWRAELRAMYLAPAAWGQVGIAHGLMDGFQSRMARDGYRELVLWVFADNPRARAFYAREGLRFTGDRKAEPIGPTAPEQVRYGGLLPDAAFVEGLATRLDRHHHQWARRYLEDDCRYLIAGREHVGADQIITMFAANTTAALARLDQVTFESEVRPMGGLRFAVHFTDRIAHHGLTHVYRSVQVVALTPGGGIGRIVHREQPGEQQRLLAFRRRAGLA